MQTNSCSSQIAAVRRSRPAAAGWQVAPPLQMDFQEIAKSDLLLKHKRWKLDKSFLIITYILGLKIFVQRCYFVFNT